MEEVIFFSKDKALLSLAPTEGIALFFKLDPARNSKQHSLSKITKKQIKEINLIHNK